MEDLLRELAAPFERLGEADMSALLAEHWDLRPAGLERLDTERDDTYATGGFVLKVAHPLDTRELIEFQVDALAAAADAGLPVQRAVPALDGSTVIDVQGRSARLLTWLPGRLLRGTTPDLAQVEAMGRMLARLARALQPLDRPAARRTFAWDLQSFPGAPDLSGLPHQVIHNDFHPGNLLVDGASVDFVTGILDFGDALYAPRVQDVGVALAYLVPEAGDPFPVVEAFVAGYADLTAAEREVLPHVVAARLRQRLVLVPLLERDADPEFLARLDRTLANLTGRL